MHTGQFCPFNTQLRVMAKHCCVQMESQLSNVCDQHTDRYDCPDALIDYLAKFDEYGLILHDGGKSIIQISFCPWCGVRLPESKRGRWFDELEALGIEEPNDENIPERYKSDVWHNS